VVASIATTEENIRSLSAWLDEYKGAGDVDVDTVIQAQDTWSVQQLDLAAQDHAIEDTLYALDRALADGRIPISTFLKHTRALARKQFFARSLTLKIKQKQAAEIASGAY
jgi:ESCRT-I complex subunit TSG101